MARIHASDDAILTIARVDATVVGVWGIWIVCLLGAAVTGVVTRSGRAACYGFFATAVALYVTLTILYATGAIDVSL